MKLQQAVPDIIHYRNPTVIDYFSKKNPQYSPEECQQLFTDLMAWFKLKSIRHQANKKTWLFGPLLLIDEMWHSFILHTREYCKFSQQFFNEYLHHDIEPIGLEHHLSPEELADFLNDSFEYLGEDWVMRYFSKFLED